MRGETPPPHCGRWLDKLARLRALDPRSRVDGARSRRYRLNEPLREEEVAEFERRHGISLPADYRAYLRFCGNGGAGPYGGVFPLGLFDGSGAGLVSWQEGDGIVGVLHQPFPHRSAWNLPEERLRGPSQFASDEEEDAWHEGLDREYWAPELANGAFPICEQGCAYRNILVVCGPERGNVWLDGRAGDEGIVPVESPNGRVTFADWYEAWLDETLRDLENAAQARGSQAQPEDRDEAEDLGPCLPLRPSERFVAEGPSNWWDSEEGVETRRRITAEVRGRYRAELGGAGWFKRARLEARIRREIAAKCDEVKPLEVLWAAAKAPDDGDLDLD